MNIDKFLKIFVPKDHSFFPLFESDAQNLAKAAELLKELMASTEIGEHERINKEIKDVEHIGDEITDKTYVQLNKSFITPFDREDIHELTANIDDVVDSINGISRRICLYKPKKLIPIYKEMADLIYEGAKEIEAAIHCLKDPVANKEKITRACEKVTEIEHRADELYFVGVSELFEKEEDTKELLKNNKILEILERCVDEEEDVTDTLKAILIKMA
jgi:predicted phosphate transport protein (TIGR00153 family)